MFCAQQTLPGINRKPFLKFAIDYYSGASIFKHSYSFSGTSGSLYIDSELRLGASGFMLGYRRHTSSGFYVGGGIMFMEPSVEIEIGLTGTASTQGSSSTERSSFSAL